MLQRDSQLRSHRLVKRSNRQVNLEAVRASESQSHARFDMSEG